MPGPVLIAGSIAQLYGDPGFKGTNSLLEMTG